MLARPNGDRSQVVEQHAHDLVGAILAATNWYDAVPVPAFVAAVLFQHLEKLLVADIPVHDLSFFIAATGVTYAFIV
jgi:hypothetical protein